jgi:hypothetical protein
MPAQGQHAVDRQGLLMRSMITQAASKPKRIALATLQQGLLRMI